MHNISTEADKMLGHNHNCDTQTALLYQKMSNTMKWKAVDCLRNKPSNTRYSWMMVCTNEDQYADR